jgi:hypothetical protein
MVQELLSLSAGLALFALGLLIFNLGKVGWRLYRNARRIPGPKCNAQSASIEHDASGIFVEHGMVYDPDEDQLIAQQKPSAAYYELFFRR